MKKLCFLLIFLVSFGLFIFGDTGGQEEIDFLLFMPNSSNQFVNEDQAGNQLDYLAAYLLSRNLVPAQICVYGYSAVAVNDIEPVTLSRDRAFFVINELEKRGVPGELFSVPVAYGEVGIWGANTSEENRLPNRRVRILLDGNFITPDTLAAAEPAIMPVITVTENPIAEPEKNTNESVTKFPWMILLPLIILALLALLALLLFRRKIHPIISSPDEETDEETPPVPPAAPPSPPAKEPAEVPAAAPIPVPVASSIITVNLEEEIRFCAYELYLGRNGQNEDAYVDWCMAVLEVGSRYKADGYRVYLDAGTWWAEKTFG